MKKFLTILAVALIATSANALDIASLAGKVQSAADKASAKIEEAQAKNDAKTAETKSKIENKIADLKEKIAKWQSSDNANSVETLQAIAKAKESIARLTAQLKALQ